MSNELGIARRLESPVLVAAGELVVIDARGFRALVVRPESGGTVKWSVVHSAGATAHDFPAAPAASAANAVVMIDPVLAIFYLVEATTADSYVHGIP